ncbi:MAG: CPBP family intramembrane glutamic endopeptidase [Bacilli bacterium]|nr:CPBP family intramembrane glutamic endopeptidase [Bacilli bacterium]
MTDDVIKSLYDKFIKGWLKKNYKFLLVILIYLMYQGNFLIALLSSLGLSISSLSKNLRMVCLIINDLTYVIVLLLMFKSEIKNGLLDLKNHFTNRAILSLNCWIAGCLIMTISSIIISLIVKKDVSNNEAIVRQSIQLAPFYMLFTCSIVAPVIEEMVFRRALYGLIKFKWLFILVSGLGFGLLHVLGSNPAPLDYLYVIPYGSMGCAFAYLLSRTKNITLPIIIHMIHNTILVIVQIIGG